MVGHGSPNSAFIIVQETDSGCRKLRRRFGRLMVACAVLFAAHLSFGNTALAQADVTTELRVFWGGASLKQWHGTITANLGTVKLVRLLRDDLDVPGSVWDENAGVEIRQPTPRPWDAIDISVKAPADAMLRVVMHDPTVQNAAPIIQEIPLRELLSKPVNRELDRANNRLSIRRVPFDLLHVNLQHGNLVFAPGDSIQFEVEPRCLPVAPGTALQLRARLVSTANGQEISTQEQTIKATAEGTDPPTSFWKFRMPETEGIYDVVVEAIEQALWRLPKSKQIAERHIQLVVIGDRTVEPSPGTNVAWSRVLEIDPANPAWYERLRAAPLIPGLRAGPLGNGGMQTWQHPLLGPLARLKEQRIDQEPYWEAYPLSISRPGAPHILEVEYPSDFPQSLAISLVEPNAAGWVVPIGLDSGVFVSDDSMVDGTAKMVRHRIIFWPRTTAPMVLIANRGQMQGAYGKIRVLAGPNKLPPMFPAGEPNERLLGGHMSQPLLAENFGAPEFLDSRGRSLDDWKTFYLGATRLAEYVRHVGYNAQMLNVLGDGSSIYPSRHLQVTQQYDTGESFENGQDPLRKDVLELTLRVFDREHVKLIPSLRFNALMPELESRLRHGGPQAEGIRLIGQAGQEHLEKSQPLNPAVPRYNPLNPHVQEAMLDVVRELVQRYGTHPSFAGLAIEMSADSSTHLPGEAWGLDDDTIARFVQATNVQVPGAGPNRFAERARLLAPADRTRFVVNANSEHAQWLKWRALTLADFYRRIQAELTAVRRDAVLYLSASTLFDEHEAQQWLRPALPPKARVDEVLLMLGLRPDLLRQDRGLVFLRPQRVLPPGSVADQGILSIVNQSSDLDAVFARMPATGSLLLHDPLLLYNKRDRLTSFEAKSPFGKDKTVGLLFSQLSPSDQQNRERFVHALATLDAEAIFDGGWLQSMGQQESLVDVISAYRRIPAAKFETHPDSKLPVTIRTFSDSKNTYAYVVNDSQWPATVDLQVSAPVGCQLEELSGNRRLPAFNPAGWRLRLEPFDLVAVRFLAPGVKIAGAQLSPNAAMQAWLTQRKSEFQKRLQILSTRHTMNVLSNPSFELPAAGEQIPGWSLLTPATGTLELAAQGEPGPAGNGKQPGKNSLHFKCTGTVASLRTEIFRVPSRRLCVQVHLRVKNANQQPALQLIVEDGRGYQIPGPVGLGSGNALTEQWFPYTYPLKNLPADGSTQLRFGVDMIGPGEVWIDDVQLLDLDFSKEERLFLAELELATQGQLLEGKLGECARALNGYWPRFLNAYVPLPTDAGQQQMPIAAPDSTKAAEKAANKPSRPLEKLFKGKY